MNGIHWRRDGTAVVVGAVLLAAGFAQAADLPSTPETATESAPAVQKMAAPSAAAPSVQAVSAPTVDPAGSIAVTGLNFTATGTGTGFIPPDTMGAVGTTQIVEMINGNFEVFDKATGASLDSRSLDSFWEDIAGVAIPQVNTCVSGACTRSGHACTVTANCPKNLTFDPRIVFDPATNRWFATSEDKWDGNNIYVARSDTDDALGTWKGLLFAADTVGASEFHDYDTLGLNADALAICTQDFDGGGNESCYSVPKADILAATPTTSRMTRFEATPAGLPVVAGSIQPILDFGPSNGRMPLLGAESGKLYRADIFGGSGGGATLGTISTLTGDPGHAAAPAARQPHPFDATVTIENITPRFPANVVKQGGSLWAVHAVEGSSANNSALRWYEIDEAANTILQTGLIDNADEDYHEPAIAVNEHGHVVIGYTCSGPNLAPGSCVSVGSRVGGMTVFEPPRLVHAGAGYYYRDFRDPATGSPKRNRWGDYSATVLDPVNSCRFWNFQEFVSVSATGDVGPSPKVQGGDYGVQVTELVISPPTLTMPGPIEFGGTCLGGSATATLDVCNTTTNTGACANLVVEGIVSSDPQFTVVPPTSGFPVTISPDFCLPIQVKFTPKGGAASATFTVSSNDPSQPAATVTVTGTGTQPKASTMIANGGDFGSVCAGSFRDEMLTVANSGGCPLTISGISSSSADFRTSSVIAYPLVVAPASSVQIPIRFQPVAAGVKAGTITVTTDDPANPIATVAVTGSSSTGDIRVSGSAAFGAVCAGTAAEKTVTVCNVGSCNLAIASASFGPGCADFTVTNNPFPATLAPASCMPVTAAFTPTTAGPKSCTLAVASDDPDSPLVNVAFTANTPLPILDVTGDLAFLPEVIQSTGTCRSTLPFPVSNKGACSLTVTGIAVGGANGGDFMLAGMPPSPVPVMPGHLVGEGNLAAVFAPTALDRDRIGSLTVTYESDPITHATSSVTRAVCGEGTRTGARVLARVGGTPLQQVTRIQLHRVNANRSKTLIDTTDVARLLALKTVTPASPCMPFSYHREYGSVDNPVQLLPGAYQVTVTAIVNGKKKTQSVGFDVTTCDYNPSIIVNF